MKEKMDVVRMGDATPEDVQRVAKDMRDAGVIIAGCSFCARNSPTVEAGPQACPFCGRMVEPGEPFMEEPEGGTHQS